MNTFYKRLGVFPFLLLGTVLAVLGVMAMNYIVDSWWPFDVTRLDLVRATALDRLDATSLLEAANTEIVLAFLAAVMLAATGLALPVAYFLNGRFGLTPADTPLFLVVLRQAIWVGLFAAFCVWLQMNRTLGVAVALLVATVLVLLEFLLLLRTRAASVGG